MSSSSSYPISLRRILFTYLFLTERLSTNAYADVELKSLRQSHQGIGELRLMVKQSHSFHRSEIGVTRVDHIIGSREGKWFGRKIGQMKIFAMVVIGIDSESGSTTHRANTNGSRKVQPRHYPNEVKEKS
jgi:hypothetical protein